jgi:hypothetical protein
MAKSSPGAQPWRIGQGPVLMLLADAVTLTAMIASTAMARATRRAVTTTVSVEYPASGSARSICHRVRMSARRWRSRVSSGCMVVLSFAFLLLGVCWYSEAGEDAFDGREADKEQEPGEQHDDGEAHAFGGGLIGGLGFGQLVCTQ